MNILVLNPNPAIKIKGTGVCMGTMLEEKDDWNVPLAEAPLGTYALFRSNEEFVELLSDGVASRTIWYYHDAHVFIASTSQRAIIMLIGGFQFNTQIIPWMLSSGVTGPQNSYDNRIKQIPPDSRCVVDLKKWKLSLFTKEISFIDIREPVNIQKKGLEKELDYVFCRLKYLPENWVLPLSGGVDSRAILLLLLKHNIQPRTVTWGTSESILDRKSDAYIAKKLAGRLNIANDYYPVEIADTPFSKILQRFLIAGEGRIDHIGGYLDGFELWNSLCRKNIQGIIRGDEGFGWGQVYNEEDVYHSLGIKIFNESKLWNNFKRLGIPEPLFPEDMKRRHQESLAAWRDRLYHIYRIPVMLAALNDLKLPFLEISNPFLTQNILKFVRTLPDHQRTKKILFRNYVTSISPAINYAGNSSLQTPKEMFGKEGISDYLIDEIQNNIKNDIFSSDFMYAIIAHWNKSMESNSLSASNDKLKAKLKDLIPARIKSRLRSSYKTQDIDIRLFVLRTIILIKMNEMLKTDATLLKF